MIAYSLIVLVSFGIIAGKGLPKRESELDVPRFQTVDSLQQGQMMKLNLQRYTDFGFSFVAEFCKEKWSPKEEEANFEPAYSVLENWTSIAERSEKIIKPDRHIVNNKPIREQPPSKPNSKEVSETDLFLLGAIEKLAYRLDFLEKRLQRTEQMLYRVIAGNQFNEKVEPCPEHFNRYGGACFHVSTKQLNWKSASSTCRNLGAVLLEFESAEEENVLLASLQIDSSYKGRDYWTGGLNPGLLWIWSNSAKPIVSNEGQSMDIKQIEGNGRCLLMGYQPPTKSYRYKGAECSMRHYFICRYLENSTGRHLERLERALERLKN